MLCQDTVENYNHSQPVYIPRTRYTPSTIITKIGFSTEVSPRIVSLVLEDISSRGFGVISPLPLEVGQKVQIHFEEGLSTTEGTVTWVTPTERGYRVGLSTSNKTDYFDKVYTRLINQALCNI